MINGGGKHVQNLTNEQLDNFLKWNRIGAAQFTAQTTLVKTSICLFILRIISVVERKLTYSIYTLICLLVSVNLSFFIYMLVNLIQCSLLEAQGLPITHEKCYVGHDYLSLGYFQAGIYNAPNMESTFGQADNHGSI